MHKKSKQQTLPDAVGDIYGRTATAEWIVVPAWLQILGMPVLHVKVTTSVPSEHEPRMMGGLRLTRRAGRHRGNRVLLYVARCLGAVTTCEG